MLNECIPYFEAAYTQRMTVHAGYAITGKTFVGPLTSPQSGWTAIAADPLAAGDGSNLQCPSAPTANGQVGGVAAWDAASGGKAAIIRGAGTMLPVTSGAAVSIGDELMVDNQGRVITFAVAAGNRKVGKAHSAAGAAGVDVIVELYALALVGT
jgi:hypothetical protein